MKNLILTLTIWVMCFACIIASVILTYNWYRDRGPDIQIYFKNAVGLVPEQSKIIYRGVQVGKVTDISLDQDSDDIIVTAKLTKHAVALIGKDSRFWIVQPELGLDRVSNLSAIATGDFIEVEPVKGEFVNKFVGLEDMPVAHRLASGLRLVIKAKELAGINVDSPVLYHGLQIGEIDNITLTDDKHAIKIIVDIYKDYIDLVRKNSYFSNISGFRADLHLFGGSHIRLDSLRTLLKGGINLHTTNFSAPVAKVGAEFKLLSAEKVLEMQEG